MKPVKVIVNDTMQKGYVYWRTKPMGRGFRPEFNPQLTPKQMLELGVFGGKYMNDCRDEFRRAGSGGRSCRRSDTGRRSITSESPPLNLSQNGEKKVGFTT